LTTIKQIQYRLLNKKKSLNKVSLNITKAENGKNTISLRKLDQEKCALGRDIKKLERQLITKEKALREKKQLNTYQHRISTF
jgi:hypothetical protein